MSVTLRGYQSDCADSVFKAIEEGHRKIGVVMPTGSGKTTIFGKIAQMYRMYYPTQRVVVISHLGLLTSQTGERFRSEWGLESGVLQADRFPNKKEKTVITTMQSFRDMGKLERWSRMLGAIKPSLSRLNVGMIIIDEAHYAGADSYQQIMNFFPDAVVLGFTATPFRENKLMTNLFDKVAYSCSMHELIQDGYLVPPKLNLASFDVHEPKAMYSQIKGIIETFHKNDKCVIYMKTIEEAKDLRNVLEACGIRTEAVTSELVGEKRDDLLVQFRKGEGPQVLTTVDVLTAGFDSPNLKCIIMPYKVGSITTYLQRVGRGLRPYKGKKECMVYAGGDSPGVEEGFWETITKTILRTGGKKFDRYDEDLEYLKGIMSTQEYNWTKDIVKMAKEVKKSSMNMAELIVNKQFPESLLDHFVKDPPVIYRDTGEPCTDKQRKFLDIIGVKARVTKKEASAIIDAHMVSTGKKVYQEWELVPSGRFKGKPIKNVPKNYWMALKSKQRNSELYKSYVKFARRINESKKSSTY